MRTTISVILASALACLGLTPAMPPQERHNAESHNHNDVGNFIVYVDGRPILIDVGVGTYTAKTFSPERYEIWTMQSAYHNLPLIHGFLQKEGRQFHADNVWW